MQYKNEKKILRFIKYAPSLSAIILGLFLTLFLYIEKTTNFNNEKKNLQNEYRENNKKYIKERVDRAVDFTNSVIQTTENKLKESLKEEVEQAYKIIENIYKNNKHKSKAEITSIIKDALRTIRFNNKRGYLFIYEMNGKNILNAGFPKIEGQDLWNYQDAKGVYLIQEMNKILKTKKQTYYDWYWFKPNDKNKKQYKKIGYFKKFQAFDWFIGTGEYLDEFKKDMELKILEHINQIRYEKTNYVFVMNYDGVLLSHVNKKFQGKNFKDLDLKESEQIGLKIIEIAKKGQGYIQYRGVFNPLRTEVSMKTSFIKGIKSLEWIIGTGFYENELEEILKKREEEYNKRYSSYIKNMVLICSFLTILLLLISKYISKDLEKKFKDYREEIKRHIDENTRQHNILSQQSKMAAMGEMIGNIAHQWRQPLSSISTAATGMKVEKEFDNLTDETFNYSINRITETVKYLSKTIDDFRNFFKPDKRKIITSSNIIVDKCMVLVKDFYQLKGVSIVKNIESVKFLTFENELIQVIINILNNAKDELIKHDDTFSKTIFISIYEKEEKVIIEIKDNAGGINEKIIDKIFEAYFTTKEENKGTGVGLYMSKEIITKNLNGDFEVYNEKFVYNQREFKGAVFKIILDKKEE